MTNKFVTELTKDATAKICYDGGGWNITPYMYAISDKDIFAGKDAINIDGKFTEEALNTILEMNIDDNYNKDTHIWYQAPFTYVTKAGLETLNHRVVLPTNITNTSKTVKTIYFLYKNTSDFDEVFLFAVGYAPEEIIYDPTESMAFYFTFTLAKHRRVKGSFILKYSNPQNIESHNTEYSNNVHKNLLATNCSRTITGDALKYSGSRNYITASDNVIVSKEYVDQCIAKLKTDNNLS